jgi:cohesin domain-containing protein
MAGCVTAAAAQDSGVEGSQKNAPHLTLGDSDGSPGGNIVVPIYFAPSDAVEVGELKFDINFVSRNLKYSSVKRGLAAEAGNVDVHADSKEGKNDKGLETTTLTVVAAVAQAKPGQKGIPGGLLGYITLNVSDKAGPANITLRVTAQAAEFGTKQPVANLKTTDGQVDILAAGSEPLVSCFFFSH